MEIIEYLQILYSSTFCIFFQVFQEFDFVDIKFIDIGTNLYILILRV